MPREGAMAYVACPLGPMVRHRRVDDHSLVFSSVSRSARIRHSLKSSETTDGPRTGPSKGTFMSNPWLKKNPFMSIWLSGANSVANRARGQVVADVKRQSTSAANKAVSDMFGFWTSAKAATPTTKRTRKR